MQSTTSQLQDEQSSILLQPDSINTYCTSDIEWSCEIICNLSYENATK